MKTTNFFKLIAVGLCVSAGSFSIAQDADGDGFPVPFDCDDNNAAINPAATEIMGDGIDNNCDGLIDSTYTWTGGGSPTFTDADGDGFPDFIDCDDNNAAVNPAAVEIMGDGIDNNCDGLIDSTYTWTGGGSPTFTDADGDGFPDFIDCDDNNAAVNPAAVEIMGDGIDNNCDGLIDSTYTWTGPIGVDADGDGFPDFMDCDDNNAAINPAAVEIIGDGIDNNCDGLVDSVYTWPGGGPLGVDADGDGFPDFIDCDDNNAAINPAAVEIIGDGIDNNCDGLVDTTFVWGGGPFGVDADGDGYPAFVDCDDNNPAVNPGAVEIPGDGIDNNCNGVIDLYIPAGGTPMNDNTSSSTYSSKNSNELISGVGPNPASNALYVTLKPDTGASVRVLDMTGKVMNVSTVSEANNVEIDLSTIPSGVYLLEVSNENIRVVERIVKQ